MQLPLLWRRQMLPIEGRQRASVEHSSPHQKTGWTVGVDKVSWVRIPLHKHIIYIYILLITYMIYIYIYKLLTSCWPTSSSILKKLPDEFRSSGKAIQLQNRGVAIQGAQKMVAIHFGPCNKKVTTNRKTLP